MGTTGRRPVYRKFTRILGRNIRARRGDLSLRDFSRKLGVSKSELHRIESGLQNVSISTIELLCARLKCGIADLFEDRPKS